MPIPFSLPPKELVSTDAILTTSTVYRKNITNYSSLFMVHLKSKIFIVFLAANDMASVLAIPVPSGSDVGGSHVPVSASGSSAGGSNAGVSGANGAGAVIGANALGIQLKFSKPTHSGSRSKNEAKVNELLALGYSADSTQMRMLTMTLDHIGTNEMCQLVWVPQVDMYLAKWRASHLIIPIDEVNSYSQGGGITNNKCYELSVIHGGAIKAEYLPKDLSVFECSDSRNNSP
ncbi:hypothetical protein FB446DRAFT_770552 [Lentinula raphanica]|nr:hypothetical protein FB446DRAFT_770552 [Lentinula raphanica]